MYKDVISYQLAKNISEDFLLKVAARIINEWMTKQAGFIQWEIHRDSSGGYTDIVSWESKDAATKCEEEMVHIPNGQEWFACYKEGSISSKNLNQLGSFK